MKFIQNTYILTEKSRPQEVDMIFEGLVLNKLSNRVFTSGSLIGVTDMMKHRDRTESYIALSTVFILSFDIETFREIMNMYPSIKREI